jgi:shikimate kinase / 3-dehydroquinate synthase
VNKLSVPVVVVGLPGSGKTAVGQQLAGILGVGWVDLDRMIEVKTGQSISEIFRVEGEQRFRELERVALEEALSSEPSVISVGGGAVLLEANRSAILKRTVSVLLDAADSTLAARLVEDRAVNGLLRPLVTGAQATTKQVVASVDSNASNVDDDASSVDDTEQQSTESSVETVEERIKALRKARASAYAPFKLRVSTEWGTPRDVANAIASHIECTEAERTETDCAGTDCTEKKTERGARATIIPSRSDNHRSTVIVGSGLLNSIGQRLRSEFQNVERVMLLADSALTSTVVPVIKEQLSSANFNCVVYEMQSGEQSKSIEQLGAVLDSLAEENFSRTDLLIAIGGGVAGDLGGFAASIFNRGIGLVQIATTVVAQVDSAIGGKTGINLEAGKNLVGTFYPARTVVSDVSVLRTLPDREYFSGFAEVIKYGVVFSEEFIDWLEANSNKIKERDLDSLLHVVGFCAEKKIATVVQDLTDEKGTRALLNFGHTIGHALERLTGYGKLLHGEAVAYGMVAALSLGETIGLTKAGLSKRVSELLMKFQLPEAGPKEGKSGEAAKGGFDLKKFGFTGEDWAAAIRVDKKRTKGEIKFIIVHELGNTSVVPIPVDTIVETALR